MWNVCLKNRKRLFNPPNIQLYHRYNPFISSGTKFKMLLKALDPKLNGTVLDVGCGVGNFDFPLSSFVNEIIGVDLSCEVLRLANNHRHLLKSDNIHFIVADLSRLPFRDKRFDGAFMVDVLEHIPSMPLDSSRDVHRTLRENAVFFIYTAAYSKFSLHYLESLLMGYSGHLWYADKEPQHVHRFLPTELLGVTSAGFKVREVKFFGHVFEYLTSILNRFARYSVGENREGETPFSSTSKAINILYALSAKIEQIDLAFFGKYPSAGAFITFQRV